MIDLDVAKLSLAEIGTRSTINSLDPLVDTSEEALYASMYYALVRDHALRAAHWNFAKHDANLVLWKALPGTPENPTTTTTGWTPAFPAPPWIYSYSLPCGLPLRPLHNLPARHLDFATPVISDCWRNDRAASILARTV
jgi:hypothetical protein